MNIYLHLETSVRELDSKLLLATLAASKGHEVVISDLHNILKGLEKKLLKPGIVHTKSLTPGKSKIFIHNKIINMGCKITSIDEEGGLIDYGYDRTAKVRYSEKTIDQASAVFTWGPEDCKTLKKYYPSHAHKIYMTGSPRVDLWHPNFSSYWKKKSKKPKKPYLLIPSNFVGLAFLSFHDRIKIRLTAGYLKREPGLLRKILERESEHFKLLSEFIEAIKHLAYKNKKFDIILRPHPVENEETWKILLNKIKNVRVIRDDGVSTWIKDAFAIMHNGCTAALEASFFKKPIVTFMPFEQNLQRKLANDLGYKVTSINKLSKKINTLYSDSKKNNKQKILNKPLPKILTKKIFVDKKEIAANKMLKIWESINNDNLSRSNNLFLFKLRLRISRLNAIKGLIRKNNRNFKFPPFDEKQIMTKVSDLIRILGIKEKISCQLLSNRTILIKQI
jgi:surface carbohydrate biosynthesis protein